MGISVDVLKPDSRIKFFWDILMLLLTWMNVFLSPLIFSFDRFSIDGNILLILQISGVLFAMDVIMQLNTAFFDQGIIQQSRSQIIYKYAKGFMIIDLISLLCFLQAIYSLDSYYILPIILKVIKVASIQTNLTEIMQPSEMATLIIRVANVFQQALIVAHTSSCIFHWVANIQYQDSPVEDWENIRTWLQSNGLLNASWYEIYINGLYFSMISMMTIGYGDITPKSIGEKIFTILFCVVSTASFAYSINTISQVITDTKKKQEQYNERMKSLNTLMVNREIDKHLQMRVRKYMEYLQFSDENLSQSSKDLELLPESIKHDVQIDMYGQIMQRLKLFHLNFSHDAINRLALAVVESSFGPGEDIFKPQEISNSLYIVMSGRVEIYAPIKKVNGDDAEINISILNKGSIFGAEDFFYQRPRQNGAKAASLSQIIEISKEKLELCLSQSEDDYEKFKMLMDMVRFANTTRGLGISCHFCQDYNHSFSECPNVTYTKKKQLLIAKWNNSQDQARDFILRRKIKSNNCRSMQNFIQKSIQIFVEFQLYNAMPDNENENDEATDTEFDEDFVRRILSAQGSNNNNNSKNNNINNQTQDEEFVSDSISLDTIKRFQQDNNSRLHPRTSILITKCKDNDSLNLNLDKIIEQHYNPVDKEESSKNSSQLSNYISMNNEQQQEEEEEEVGSEVHHINQIDSMETAGQKKQQKSYKQSITEKKSRKQSKQIRKKSTHSNYEQQSPLQSRQYAKKINITPEDKVEETPTVFSKNQDSGDSLPSSPQGQNLMPINQFKKYDLLKRQQTFGQYNKQTKQNNYLQIDSFVGNTASQHLAVPASALSLPRIVKSSKNRNTGQENEGDCETVEATIEVDSIRAIKALNNWETPVLRNFDVFKNFKQYFPNNNLSRILERFKNSMITSTKRGSRRKMMRKGSAFKKIEAAFMMSNIDSTSPRKGTIQNKQSENNFNDSQYSILKKGALGSQYGPAAAATGGGAGGSSRRFISLTSRANFFQKSE